MHLQTLSNRPCWCPLCVMLTMILDQYSCDENYYSCKILVKKICDKIKYVNNVTPQNMNSVFWWISIPTKFHHLFAWWSHVRVKLWVANAIPEGLYFRIFIHQLIRLRKKNMQIQLFLNTKLFDIVCIVRNLDGGLDFGGLNLPPPFPVRALSVMLSPSDWMLCFDIKDRWCSLLLVQSLRQCSWYFSSSHF